MSVLLLFLVHVIRGRWCELTRNARCLVTSAAPVGHPHEPVSDWGHTRIGDPLVQV